MSVRGLILSAAGGQQYTALNPLDKGSNIALSGANLTGTSSGLGLARSSKGIGAGERKYWEVVIGAGSPSSHHHGMARAAASSASFPGADIASISWSGDGSLINNGSIFNNTAGYTAGDTLGFDYDRATSMLRLLKNGALQLSLTFAGIDFPAFGANGAGVVASFNFGPAMAYAIPSGASLITA